MCIETGVDYFRFARHPLNDAAALPEPVVNIRRAEKCPHLHFAGSLVSFPLAIGREPSASHVPRVRFQ